MKANELRIGNLVNRLGETTKITAIQTIDVGGIGYVSTLKSGAITTSQIEPIPLTEEILLKCGFEIFPWGYVIKSSNDFGIRLNLKSFVYEVSGNSAVKVNYLHQLQNLYFSLTGEELKIKL